jgi:hypothetical protein
MRFPLRRWKLCVSVLVLLCSSDLALCRADDTVMMAYGGHNETIGPYWVAIDKGLIKNTVSTRACSRCATPRSV